MSYLKDKNDNISSKDLLFGSNREHDLNGKTLEFLNAKISVNKENPSQPFEIGGAGGETTYIGLHGQVSLLSNTQKTINFNDANGTVAHGNINVDNDWFNLKSTGNFSLNRIGGSAQMFVYLDANSGIKADNNSATYFQLRDGLSSHINIGANFGFGTISPDATLHVEGSFKIKDGTEGTGKILTSDADGKTSWQLVNDLPSPWTEDGIGNVFRSTGKIGFGTADFTSGKDFIYGDAGNKKSSIFYYNDNDSIQWHDGNHVRIAFGASSYLQNWTNNAGTVRSIIGTNGEFVHTHVGAGPTQASFIEGKNGSGVTVFSGMVSSNAGKFSLRTSAGVDNHFLASGTGEKSFLAAELGNLGIGENTPSAKLHVKGSVKIVDGSEGAGKLLTSDAAGLVSWQEIQVGKSWVDASKGDDTTGNGTILNPYKTIFKAMLEAPVNGVIYVLPGEYEEGFTQFSLHSFKANLTVYGMPGAVLKGRDRNHADVLPTHSFYRALYTVDTADTFNIKGHFDVKGAQGLIFTDNDAAVANIEVNTLQLESVTGSFNIRNKKGILNLVVRQGDLILRDSAGIFIGPGDANANINVVNGKIIMKKTSSEIVHDQTRMFQIYNASTTRSSHIQCNGLEVEVDPDHCFTYFIDPIWMKASGHKVILDLRGGDIKETNVPVDLDTTKYSGDDGCIIMDGGGDMTILGGLHSNYTNGVQTNNGSDYNLKITGDITCISKHAAQISGTSATAKIKLEGKLEAQGLFPTVAYNGAPKTFIKGGIKNTNTDENSVGILYNGSGLILQPGAVMDVKASHAFTTQTTNRSYKLYGNIPTNKGVPANPESEILKLTVNVVRNNQDYKTEVNGTEYVFNSGASATADSIATGLAAAIGNPTGTDSVVASTDSVTITATAGTNLTVTDTTTWSTKLIWEIGSSAVQHSPWTFTINGTLFSGASTDTTYFHETNGGVSDIRNQVLTAIQADATIHPKVGTYTSKKFGFELEAAATEVFDTYAYGGNTLGFVPISDRPLKVSTINAGYVGGMQNQISGMSLIHDNDIEL